MIWLLIIGPLVAWFLTAASYRLQAAVERKAWERKVAAADERADEADEATATWMTRAHAAEIAAKGLRRMLAKAEKEIARHQQRRQTEAGRLFPAAPRSGEHERPIVTGPTPVHDALVAERAAVVPIRKRAAKAVSRG
jgi:hypothetical protein